MEEEMLFKSNLDTNFLKLIAVSSMLIDHIGMVFFPQYLVLRWIGRLAFPIFCYCLTVGLLYTRDVKKYLGRLAIFALVSQPFYLLALNPQDISGNLTDWNILFTLFFSLLAMWGFHAHKWWLFVLGLLIVSFENFDYMQTGIALMLIFNLCRQNPALGAALYTLYYLPALFVRSPIAPVISGDTIGFVVFMLAAMPFIFIRTSFAPKIPKWFFYGFYPAHLAAIALLRWAVGI